MAASRLTVRSVGIAGEVKEQVKHDRRTLQVLADAVRDRCLSCDDFDVAV